MPCGRTVVLALLTMVLLGMSCWEASAKEDEAVVASPAKLLDLNTATASELDGLPGVGRKRAEAIVAERAKRPFRRVTELLRIKGFGPKLYGRVRALVTVGAVAALPASTAAGLPAGSAAVGGAETQ